MKITNNYDISLPLAVWLLYDDYDYINEPNYISATSLLRSTKQIILSKRVMSQDMEMDVSDKIASSMGTAIHDSVEKAWTIAGGAIMKRLGYPDKICDNIVVNPTPEYLKENSDAIPIWFEQRAFKEFEGFKIGGKFDTIIDGRLFDFKTTSVFTYLKSRKDEDYALQGGIYRWLNPELVTNDHIYINFVFTDWQKFMIRSNPDYPKIKVMEYPVEMKSLQDTESFISNKLKDITQYWDSPESDIPPCSDKELWRSEAQYKYYSDPTKTDGRATKNFDNLNDANTYMQIEKGGKGIVKTVPGEVKACLYCVAYDICNQRRNYFDDE